MKFNQISIYNVLGYNIDPVYCKINDLQENEEIEIEQLKIRKTSRFYEVENDNFHKCFSDIKTCYNFIDEFISGAFNLNDE